MKKSLLALAVLSAFAGVASAQSSVTLETLGIDSLALDHPQNICVYRFVQEGLTNAFKHGGGIDQRVTAQASNDTLSVRVSDNGTPAPGASEGSGLGRIGLRERVEDRVELVAGDADDRVEH